MKILIVFAVLIASTLAEPPVNRYLPPQSRASLSTSYGTPNFAQRQNGAGFRRPSSTYGAPKTRPSNQYLAPNNQYLPPSNQNSAPSSQYSAPSNQYSAPSSQYSAPSNQYSAPSNQYSAPSNQYSAPSNQYLAPSNQYSAPSNQYSAPSKQYQTSSNQYNAPRNQYLSPNAGILNTPSQEYGTPGFGRSNQGSGDYNQQSRQYLPPGAGGGCDDGSNGEPANYNFEYMVKDEYSGNDFGHRESRVGDRAEGLYYVLLPDGRKQTVEYEADQDGYKPRISYEDTGVRAYDRTNQGYDQNASGPY
ncbi:unnamed protein product, partial [Brenthis ino]